MLDGEERKTLHRALPPRHLGLRGQRRAGARRRGRHGRQGHPVGHRRRGGRCRTTPTCEIPADASAVIVAPSIVGDRFVQLTPVVHRRARARRTAPVLDTDRTSMPLELDQVYSSLNDLNVALGPTGANRTGALSDLLDGHRRQLRRPGRGVPRDHRAVRPLQHRPWPNNRDELFGTAAKLQSFLETLAENDTTVRQFNRVARADLRGLGGERQELAAALDNLGTAMKHGVGLREGEPRDPRPQHQRPEPGLQGAGQAARRPRRDPRRSRRWR